MDLSGGSKAASSIDLTLETGTSENSIPGPSVESDAVEEHSVNDSTQANDVNSQSTDKNHTNAARRRLKKLIAADLLNTEPTALANNRGITLLPLAPSPPKRTREEENVVMAPEESPTANMEETNPGPSRVIPTLRETEGLSRVGIRNCEPMTVAQMELTHRCINLAIAKAVRGTGPTFLGFSPRPGWILITCENEYSQKWLKNKVPALKPWVGADLSVMPDEELPRLIHCTAIIPSSEVKTPDEALRLLRAQNNGLDTEHWVTLVSKEEEDGIEVTFSIDENSAVALKEAGFVASIGFKKITLNVREYMVMEMPSELTEDSDRREAPQVFAQENGNYQASGDSAGPNSSRGNTRGQAT